MKISFFRINILISFVLLIGCSSNYKKVKTKGTFQFPVDTKISLYELKQDKAVLIDSTFLKNETEFSFSFQADYPTFYLLRYFNNEKIYLVCHPGESIKLNIENNKTLQYYVDGSADSKLLRNLIFEQEKAKSYISRLSNLYEQAHKNGFREHPRTYFDSTYNSIIDNHKDYSIGFIEDNIESLASIFALYQDFGTKRPMLLFDKQDDYEYYKNVDSVLTQLYPNTDAVIALNKDVVDAKRKRGYNINPNKQLTRGMKIPELPSVNFKGTTIDSSYFKDKLRVYYVFAAWDKINAGIQSEINSLTEKFKKQDVVFIGISLDKSEKRLNDFAKENKIKYPVICDYQYWESPLVKKLNIQHLPYFILTDENGVILSNEIKINELASIISSNLKY